MTQPTLEELEQDALLAPQVLVDMRAIYLGRVVGSTPEEAGMRELLAWFRKDPKTYLSEMLGLERAHQAKLVAWARLRTPKAEPKKRSGKAGVPDEGEARVGEVIDKLLEEAGEGHDV